MRRLLFSVALSGLAAGCLLTTNLDDLAGSGTGSKDAGPDGTQTQPPTDGNRDAQSSGSDASLSNDAGDGGGTDPNLLFADDFNRADGPVGNGWLDPKSSYRIEDNHLPISGSGFGFQADTLYRPKTDAVRDIKASIEFTPLSMPPNYPQVHVRAQPGDNYKCYAVGIPQSDNSFFFGRCAANSNFVSLADLALTENILAGRTYRLSISATGASPVHLIATLERKTESGFSVIGQKAIDDGDPDRVMEAGQYGISADSSPNWIYDNFVATKASN